MIHSRLQTPIHLLVITLHGCLWTLTPWTSHLFDFSKTYVQTNTNAQQPGLHLSPSSHSVTRPLGQNDSCVRLMSRRPKGRHPQEAVWLGFPQLPQNLVTADKSFYYAPRNPGDTTPWLVSIWFVLSACWALGEARPCPEPRPWWLRSLEGWQRGSGNVTGLGFLIDERTWMRAEHLWPWENQSNQNKFIKRPHFRNWAYGKHTDRTGCSAHSTMTPDFLQADKKLPD